MIDELSTLSTEVLNKLHGAIIDATTELQGDKTFQQALSNEAFSHLVTLELVVFKAILKHK